VGPEQTDGAKIEGFPSALEILYAEYDADNDTGDSLDIGGAVGK
jgi:hypothetical protein